MIKFTANFTFAGKNCTTSATQKVNYLDYKQVGDGAKVTGFYGYLEDDEELVIPDKVPKDYVNEIIAGSDINYIDGQAFKNNNIIRKVKMGENIKGFSNESFMGCKNLTEVTIGSNLESLGSDCFANCPNLKSFKTTACGYLYLTNGANPFSGSDNVVAYTPHSVVFQKRLQSVGVKTIGTDKHNYSINWDWSNYYRNCVMHIKCSE